LKGGKDRLTYCGKLEERGTFSLQRRKGNSYFHCKRESRISSWVPPPGGGKGGDGVVSFVFGGGECDIFPEKATWPKGGKGEGRKKRARGFLLTSEGEKKPPLDGMKKDNQIEEAGWRRERKRVRSDLAGRTGRKRQLLKLYRKAEGKWRRF